MWIRCPACQARIFREDVQPDVEQSCPECAHVFPVPPSAADETRSRVAPILDALQALKTAVPAEPGETEGPGAGEEPEPAATHPLDDASSGADLPLEPERVEWQVGDVILKLYDIRQVHESGGMGKVYRVHHRQWNVDLAVKSPRKEFLRTEKHKALFVREAETWVHLGLHPNIVSCFYVREIGGIPRVFAEYVEAGTLRDWVESGRLYAGDPAGVLERILDISIQFAWGLAYAHEHRIVHQDIKPGNVMMTPEGVAKVTDFGLATARVQTEDEVPGGSPDALLVSAGGMTPVYCSPEQAERRPLSFKTDVWSWAVSVLELFVGEVTWRLGPAAREALRGFVTERQAGMRQPMPEGVIRLLWQCFAEDPDARPTSMYVVAAKLMEVYEEVAKRRYERPTPKPAELLADALNNRAVSMMDLGKVRETVGFLRQALKADPRHPQSLFNWGLVLWRNGRITDRSLLEQLEELSLARGGAPYWLKEYFAGLLHFERWDFAESLQHLKRAVQAEPALSVQGLLEQIRAALSSVPRLLLEVEGPYTPGSPVAFSQDLKACLTSGADRSLRVWDIATGASVKESRSVSSPCSCVALSPNAEFAVSGHHDEKLRLWGIGDIEPPRSLPQKHAGRIHVAVISGDGRYVVSGGDDRRVCLWEVAKRSWLHTYEGHVDGVTALAVTREGTFLASGSSDGVVCVWAADRARPLHTFSAHGEAVTALAFTPDGGQVLSGGADGVLRLWDRSAGDCLWSHSLEGRSNRIHAVAIGADGRWAVTGSRDGTVRLWEVHNGRCVRTIPVLSQPVVQVVFDREGYRVLARGQDKAIRVWILRGLCDPQAVRLEAPLVLSTISSVERSLANERRFNDLLARGMAALQAGNVREALAISAKVRQIPGRERAEHFREYEAAVGLHCRRQDLLDMWGIRDLRGHKQAVAATRISADGTLGLSGSADGMVRVWDLLRNRCIRQLQGHSRGVTSVALTADKRLAVSGSMDKSIRVWDLGSGQCTHVLASEGDAVMSVALDSTGRLLLAGTRKRHLEVWYVPGGRLLRTDRGHSWPIGSVHLSRDGRHGYSSGADAKLRLWDVRKQVGVDLFKFEAPVTAMAISADERLALVATEQPAIVLLQLPTGKSKQVFRQPPGTATCLALTACGRWAVSGHEDGGLVVWSVEEGTRRHVFTGHDCPVTALDLSLDCRFLVSACSDGSLRIWEMSWAYAPARPGDPGVGSLAARLTAFLEEHRAYMHDLPAAKGGRFGKWVDKIFGRDEGKLLNYDLQRLLARGGRPVWSSEDADIFHRELCASGFGWLGREELERRLQAAAGAQSAPGGRV